MSTYRLDYTPTKWVALTKHDTTLQPSIVGIYVGGAGNVVLVGVDDVEVTLTSVPAGTFIPGRPKLIKAATTATLLIGMA